MVHQCQWNCKNFPENLHVQKGAESKLYVDWVMALGFPRCNAMNGKTETWRVE
jgi:hypothetical protein